MGGKASPDTSGINQLSSMAQGLYNQGQSYGQLGQDWLNQAKQIYSQGPGWLIDKYKAILGGGNPMQAYQASGLGDVMTQQVGGWENQQKQAALDVAGMGPVSKVLANEGIGQQGEQMKSQNIMSQLQSMLQQIGTLGMSGAGLFAQTGSGLTGQGIGAESAGMQGQGTAAQMQTELAMQAQQAQGSMMGNIIKSIASIGGTVAGSVLGGPMGGAAGGSLGGALGGAISGQKPWGYVG